MVALQSMALVKALVGRVVGLSDLAQAGLAVGTTSLLIPLLPHLSPATLGAVHLASVATHLGAHLYVGLVAGPTMFLNMPRHQFGDLQVWPHSFSRITFHQVLFDICFDLPAPSRACSPSWGW